MYAFCYRPSNISLPIDFCNCLLPNKPTTYMYWKPVEKNKGMTTNLELKHNFRQHTMVVFLNLMCDIEYVDCQALLQCLFLKTSPSNVFALQKSL